MTMARLEVRVKSLEETQRSLRELPGRMGDLEHRLEPETLVCHACRLVYAVEDGIPIMLIDEAKPL